MADDNLRLTIINQPYYGDTARIVVDQALFPTEESMMEWLDDRYGRGTLERSADGTIIYTRDIPGPNLMWRALRFVANKSYS
ncbi:MAG: hypothetical protein AAF432_10750 [Planctomycetota bacterium]